MEAQMIDDTLLVMMLVFGCGGALGGLIAYEIWKLGALFIHWVDNWPHVTITIIGTKGI